MDSVLAKVWNGSLNKGHNPVLDLEFHQCFSILRWGQLKLSYISLNLRDTIMLTGYANATHISTINV